MGVGVLLEVALGARERGVDDVTKVWLHADVQEAEHREHLVDGAVAQLVVQVVGDHKVLEALQQLHGKEEEDVLWIFKSPVCALKGAIAMKAALKEYNK